MSEHGHAGEHTGHHWQEADRVRDFVERMDRRAGERDPQFRLMARIVGRPSDAPLRILDLGAGYGAAAAALLAAYPSAHAVLLDASDEMIRVGGEGMAGFTGRYEYVKGDFGPGMLPEGARGPFDVVVSSSAIHHLPADGIRSLYRDIHKVLVPGGVFLNLDLVAAPDEELTALYRTVAEAEREERGEPPPNAARPHHSHVDPLAEHLRWLADAGFVHVDCFWKRLGSALVGGFRAA